MKFNVGDRVFAKPIGSKQWEFAEIIGFTNKWVGKHARSGKTLGVMYYVDIENYALDDVPRWEDELKAMTEVAL